MKFAYLVSFVHISFILIINFLFRCVEILIDSQVKSRKDMLDDIEALYRAESTAEKKLHNIMVSDVCISWLGRVPNSITNKLFLFLGLK